MEELLKHLSALAIDLKNIPIDKLKANIPRAALVIVNTYTGQANSLGHGPACDGVRIASICRNYSIPVFYLHDSPSQTFQKFFPKFLSDVSDTFLVFYTGHGSQFQAGSHGNAQALCFVDDHIPDYELIKIIIQHKAKNNKLILVADCCHAGTIWNLNDPNAPPNCISISGSTDDQLGHQAGGAKQFGFFSDSFYRALESSHFLTPTQIKDQVNSEMKAKKLDQSVEIHATSPQLLNQPLLPQPIAVSNPKKMIYSNSPPNHTQLYDFTDSYSIQNQQQQQEYSLEDYQKVLHKYVSPNKSSPNSPSPYFDPKRFPEVSSRPIPPQDTEYLKYVSLHVSPYLNIPVPPFNLSDEELRQWYQNTLK